MKLGKKVVWIIIGIVGLALVVAIAIRMNHWRPRSLTLQGAVIRQDEDARKQSPIPDAEVIASDGVTSVSTESDASGYFKIKFPEAVWPGQTLNIVFRHDGYKPSHLHLTTGLRLASNELYVVALTPTAEPPGTTAAGKPIVVSNIRVRYTINSQLEENVGSAVKTFEVANKANVPCNGQPPCSPDGKWKASRSSVSLDAGPDNEFRNVRASCIAGPCPFTRLDSSGFVNGGRTIRASAVSWAGTVTFLMEAEVFRTAINSRVRELYPVVFGQALHFTLPPTQEGVSLEADLDGQPMVFPLGPELYLSWATCSVRDNRDQEKTLVYRCELKPGYTF